MASDPASRSRLDALRAGWLPAILVTLVGCAPTAPDEQRIRETLGAMIEALESGDIEDFMEPVAADFVGGDGRLDRRGLGLLARRERLAREAIRIRRTNTEIELVGDDRAIARFHALATGGSGLLPDEGQLWQVETGWRRDDGRWRLISAEWSRVLGD